MKYAYLVAIGAGAALVYAVTSRLTKALPSAATVGAAINPTSDQNLAYKGANAVVQTLTGTDDTLGTWLHKTFSGDDERVAAMLAASPVKRTSDADAYFSTSFNNPMGDYFP